VTGLSILIIDYTTHHPEVVNALRRIFADHNVRLALTSSFKTKFAGEFVLDADTTLIKPKKLATSAWLAQLAPIYAEQDLVIFSTALRDPLLLATLKLQTRAKKIAFVHNTHYFTERFPINRSNYSAVFCRALNTLPAWRHFLALRWKFIKREIKDLRAGTRFSAFAERIDYFCFGSEHLATYFSSLTGLENVLVLPTCNSPQLEALQWPIYGGVLRIAIVGLVSPERRNYLEVISALGEAHFNAPVELHILGRCPNRSYAERIVAKIQQVSCKQLKVLFNPDSQFIPAEELQQRLSSIHLLLSPIQLAFSFHFYAEQYGLTKISGAEADCIRYHRPLLMPSAYRYDQRTAPFIIEYKDALDLAARIEELQATEKLSALYRHCAEFSHGTSDRDISSEFIERCLSAGIDQA
jgi:hypothetical protein